MSLIIAFLLILITIGCIFHSRANNYDYTLNSIKVVKNSINQLNTKITLILTISLLVFWLIVAKIYLLI
ncbi:Similarity (fragment) [Microcystis aeruginosa PCC 9701]|uniref:Similarity n=1 Tax=Microcystis aeruginosa PCC 9701 TaxID=721123 RepID=I4INI9_MICAE